MQRLWRHTQGDNDPVDVVEIGGVPLETGGVYPVKYLGAYAMIDAGELDWKIVCIRADHPLAPVLHDIADVERCALLAALVPGLRPRYRVACMHACYEPAGAAKSCTDWHTLALHGFACISCAHMHDPCTPCCDAHQAQTMRHANSWCRRHALRAAHACMPQGDAGRAGGHHGLVP
jgi:hypothetical protein